MNTKTKTIFEHNIFSTCIFLVLKSGINEQSVVILWVNWFKNECFWHRFTCIGGVISHKWHFLCVWKLYIHPVVTAPTIWTKSSVVGVSSLKRSPSTSSTTTFPLVWWVRQWLKFAFYGAFLSLNDLVMKRKFYLLMPVLSFLRENFIEFESTIAGIF